MNQHFTPNSASKEPAEETLLNLEIDVADVVNMLEKIGEFVDSVAIELGDELAWKERDCISSIARATQVLAARALTSLEAYRLAHPDA